MTHTLFALDFDGVLADTMPLIESHYITAMADDLRSRFGDRVPSEAAIRSLIQEQYPIYHCSGVVLARAFGLGDDWVEHMYATVPPTTPPEALAYLQPDPHLGALLEALKDRGDTICILTQSHASHIAQVTQRLGIHKVFKDAYILDRTATPGATKRTTQPYEVLLSRHGHRPHSRRIMVEDSPANLPAAKATGFETALVGPAWATGGPVDHRAPTVHALLQAYLDGQLHAPAES